MFLDEKLKTSESKPEGKSGENEEEKVDNEMKTGSGHIANGAASRRWLILMEPVDALSLACTLGAKVNSFFLYFTLTPVVVHVRGVLIFLATMTCGEQ